MRASILIGAAVFALASASLHSEELSDTVRNAIGNTIKVEEATGATTFLHLKANHRFKQRMINPRNAGQWIVKGNKVCQQTSKGLGECHALTGKWWVKEGQLCQKPDASPSNFSECHDLAAGKKIGDTWKMPDGAGGEMTLSLLKGISNGP